MAEPIEIHAGMTDMSLSDGFKTINVHASVSVVAAAKLSRWAMNPANTEGESLRRINEFAVLLCSLDPDLAGSLQRALLRAEVYAAIDAPRAEVRHDAAGDWFAVYVGGRKISKGWYLRKAAEAHAAQWNEANNG